jgi:GT2 family glycosyltransferase
MKNTAVIIVNWNGRHLLEQCLQSLVKQTYQNFKIVLVDNGSTDDSVGFVQKKFPQVQIVELRENTGFARGNNIGISVALKNKSIKNIILLNNDTKVEKIFIEKLIVAVDNNILNKKNNNRIGVLAPKMLLWQKNNSQKIIDAIGAETILDGRGYNIGNGEIDRGQYDSQQEVFGFCGGAVLLKRVALEDIVRNNNWQQEVKNGILLECQQYFDNYFFAYYEDSDLSWRLRLRGWRVVTVPKAVVWHLHSATAEPFSFFKAYYLNRNRFLMMLKNYPRPFLWRGLWRIPASYFKFLQTAKGKKYIQGRDKTSFLKKTVRKIKMIGILIRVIGNIFWHCPKIFKQRKIIQKNKLIQNKEIKKWVIFRYDKGSFL